jgi:hypothetical protein
MVGALALTKMGLTHKDVTIIQIVKMNGWPRWPPCATPWRRYQHERGAKTRMVQLDLAEYDLTYPLQSVITTRLFEENRPPCVCGVTLAQAHREQPQSALEFQTNSSKSPRIMIMPRSIQR